MIWPIKIPIPRRLGVAYRGLIDSVHDVLGFGPLDEERIWGGNSDGTRQDAVGETGITDGHTSPTTNASADAGGASSPKASSAAAAPLPSAGNMAATAGTGSSTVNTVDTAGTLDAPVLSDKQLRRRKDKAAGIPRHFKLGLVTAPPAGVLLLLASTCITGRTVREGIVAEPIRPFDVMILFLSFAYIALSLDQVGLLRYLAFLVAKKATDRSKALETPGQTPGQSGTATPTAPSTGPSGTSTLPTSTDDTLASPLSGSATPQRRKKGHSAQPVFAALYALFIFISALAGNDPIVLSGTPFVAYFSRTSGSPAEPYAFMEMYAANLASAILVSSNPTNLVLSAAFGLSFLEYSAWMVLPTLAAAVVLYPLLAVQYRPQLRQPIRPPDVDPRSALVDPFGAVWASVVFILAVIVLVVLSATGQLHGAAGVWSVAAPAAVLVALRDMWHDWRHRGERDIELDDLRSGERGGTECECDDRGRKRGRQDEDEKDKDEEEGDGQELELHFVRPVMQPGMRRRVWSRVCQARASRAVAGLTSSATPGSNSAPASSTATAAPATVPTAPGHTRTTSTRADAGSPTNTAGKLRRRRHPIHWFRRTFPTVSSILPRLPFPLVLFALSFFILVRSLDTWIGIWARWWAIYVSRTGLAGAIFMLALLSVVGSNVLGTNIGCAVTLLGVVEEWRQRERPEQRVLYASMLTLATGCNYGAFSFTFSASLAGLLWKDLLFARGIRVRIGQFCVNNILPLIVTMLVSCLIIAAEVCIML